MPKPSYEAIEESSSALQAGDLDGALQIRNRELAQVSGTFDAPAAQVMNYILTRTPALLADCPPAIVQQLRVPAAMMELWGTNRIKQFLAMEPRIDYRFDAQVIANMLHSHACFLQRIEEFRAVGVSRVRLLGSGGSDDCDVCREVEDAAFTVDTVPEIPLANCHCETGHGCRVMVIADAGTT